MNSKKWEHTPKNKCKCDKKQQQKSKQKKEKSGEKKNSLQQQNEEQNIQSSNRFLKVGKNYTIAGINSKKTYNSLEEAKMAYINDRIKNGSHVEKMAMSCAQQIINLLNFLNSVKNVQ